MSHLRPRRNVSDLERNKFNAHGDLQIHPGFAASDADGRLRVTSPFALFDSHQTTTDDEDAWEQLTVGGGSSSTYVKLRSSTTLTCDTGIDDRATRQSRLYFPAVPGRSNLLMVTAVIGEAVPGIRKRVGLFDDNDGVFFELDGDGVCYTVTRSSVSGTPVDTRIAQADWNVDKLDGHSLTRRELDLTKPQVFIIDLNGLNVGTVRYGFEYDGLSHYVNAVDHAGEHAPAGQGAYMKTSTLPVRYEVYNVDGGNSGSIEQISASYMSEGGYSNVGFEFTASNGAVTRSISVRTPILAIRCAALLNGDANRRHAQLIEDMVYASGNDVYWEVVHLDDPTTVTGTFGALDPASMLEVSTNVTVVTGPHTHIVRSGYSSAGAGPKGGIPGASTAYESRHTIINRNMANDNSGYLVLFCTPFTGTANVSAQLTSVEHG